MKKATFLLSVSIALLTIVISGMSLRKDYIAGNVTPPNCYFIFNCAEPAVCIFTSPTGTVCGSIRAGEPAQAIGVATRNDCLITGAIFCCARFVATTKICPSQVVTTFVDANGAPQINQFAKIAAVYCKNN